ncbi:DUF7288 family protein [Halosimplex halophilum]|uniref:DUF7288 family protein n=1 Tax=Halosimplex halophilum TaxID=2559572 RepID=UPI00107F2571|nr:hypothetical protein [Halosimplex halophilum]
MRGERGQLFALEGILAALVVLAGIAFALQATVLTPTTSGATAAPVDASTIESTLAKTAETGELQSALVDDWGTSGFEDADGQWYTGAYPSNPFGTALKQSVGPTVTVNVVIYHRTPTDGRQRTRLIYNGVPGDGAVRASTVVTLYDRDVCSPPSSPSSPSDYLCTSTERSDFFAADLDTSADGHLYNVLEVEVVAWQT